MAIIANKHLDKNKHIWVALSSAIYGIGKTTAVKVCEEAGIDVTVKVSDLTQNQIDKIRSIVDKLTIEGDLRRDVNLRIKLQMDIGSYRGIRHRRGLPVRGQNTKTNARTRKGRTKKSHKSN